MSRCSPAIRARLPPRGSAPAAPDAARSRSAAVLVGSSAPLDQFVVRHPSYFFDASPEHALINPDNLHILVEHVKCAAFELPFSTDDAFGAVSVQEVLGVLAGGGLVHHVRRGSAASTRTSRRRAVALDERVVSGRRRQPALDLVRQLRRRRSDARARR